MPSINVLRKVKSESGWKLLPVRKDKERLDWTQVIDGGTPLVATAGTFYLEWREDGKRIRRAVGDHPRQAKEALSSQSQILSLRRSGMTVEDAPQITQRRSVSGRSIAEVIKTFTETAPLKYAAKSRSKYQNALDEFQKWAGKRQLTHLIQVGREELVEFMGHLVASAGLDHSTALDKGRAVHAVFNNAGGEIRMKRGDWPRVTEREVDIYEDPAKLERLFASATPFEYALFQTFRLSGFREQEVAFLAPDDFNPRRRTLSVTEKKTLGFRPKDKEERTIPIPEVLVEILSKHMQTLESGAALMFPTSTNRAYRGTPGGQRDHHILEKLKKLAFRAQLNCGRCTGTWNSKPATCRDRPICKQWGLHKFRHTYATTLLRDGVDLVSLQKLLGHSDLESTRKYLKALEPEDLHAKIAGSSLAKKPAAAEVG